jgi:hypothetical protein
LYFFLLSYLAKMRAEFLGADSPLDPNVEWVLPGVHSRLSLMQNEILGVPRGGTQKVASNFWGGRQFTQ